MAVPRDVASANTQLPQVFGSSVYVVAAVQFSLFLMYFCDVLKVLVKNPGGGGGGGMMGNTQT